LRALRANHVFCADEKRIRTENTVMDKSQGGFVWFSSVRNQRSARTVSRPRKKRNTAISTGGTSVAMHQWQL